MAEGVTDILGVLVDRVKKLEGQVKRLEHQQRTLMTTLFSSTGDIEAVMAKTKKEIWLNFIGPKEE